MSQSKLLVNRRFYPLFWTQFCGAFNDNFLKNALIILVTFRATEVMGVPPAQMVALAGGVFVLPFFLFSATAGQLADKYEKGAIIRIIKLAEIAIMALAAFGFGSGRFPFLLAVLFLMGLHSTFFGPIKYSILPQHLTESELVGGNALIGAGTFLSILLGTIAGGTLISIPDTGPTIVGAALVAIAVVGYLASRAIPAAPPVSPDLRVQWNPLHPTLEILAFTRRNRPVFLSVLGISWFWFYGAAVLSLFPPYGKEVLHAEQGVVTLFLACFSIGIAIGSLLCERMSRKRLELGLVPLGSIGITLFAADLFLVGAPDLGAGPIGVRELISHGPGLRILFDLVLMSVFSGFFIVPLYTMIQERSEASHRSRIVAGNNILNALFMVLASGLLVGLMKAGLSIPETFLVLAALNGAVAVYIYLLLPEFLIRFVMWMVANVMYRLRVEGGDRIPAQGPALLVCNHVSFVDWLVVGAAIPRPVRFVMYYKFMRIPLVGRLMRRYKVIPIASAKEDPVTLELAYERIAAELRDGEIVCIFPEGQITHDGKLAPFRGGVEKILARTPVPVVPMALNGLWGSLFSRKDGPALGKLPRRFWARVTLRVGEPIPAAQATAQALQDQVEALAR